MAEWAEPGAVSGRPEGLPVASEALQGWFGIPPLPSFHVARERLLDELDGGEGPFVLVSAPAGSGKTSLVAEWVARLAGEKVAWVTFDEQETGFWQGIVECLVGLGVPLATITPASGAAALDPVVRRKIAATLAAEEDLVTVVVDGYVLDSPQVASDVDFLLRHSGHRLRLVLITRADPVLPLYRYRLEDAMTEIRMADLAFTDVEAGRLVGAMEVSLTAESVRVLNERTRGWVTGLRFAGKMLGSRDDPDSAVAEVAGHTGNIAEYLMGEVLAAHPPELRQVLMATSIPDTIRPGLAEALVGRSAARTLAFLARVNAFIEQVPEHEGYYRYHPFFRELLRAELAYADPESMEVLHRRAAEWFADEGMFTPAVHHFASSGAWPEVVRQVVDNLAVGRLLLDDRANPLVQDLRELPADLDEPAAQVVRAGLALGDGDVELFDDLFESLEHLGDDERPVTEAVSLSVAVLMALRARFAGDAAVAADLAATAERGLNAQETRRSSESHPELTALLQATKGIAKIRQGRMEEARVAFEAGAGAARRAAAEPLLVECLGHLALIACCTDGLAEAEALAERALATAVDAGIRPADRSAALQIALAWVALERYELRLAAEHVRSAERSDFLLADPVPRSLLTLVKARLQEAHGDRSGALARVHESAEGLTDEHGWLLDRLHIESARMMVARREPEAALAEIADVGHTGAEGEAALVLAQAHLRLGDDSAAEAALAEVFEQRVPSAVRVSGCVAESARHLRRGSTAQARQSLSKGLRLAAGPRLRRPFHEAPAAVRQLLLEDQPLRTEHAWLFDVAGMAPQSLPTSRGPAPSTSRLAPTLPVETLTVKEREVLGHLAELLTTEEIAAAMYVSVNTVRTHVRNVLRKLGVNSRNTAVRVARELQLLPGPAPTSTPADPSPVGDGLADPGSPVVPEATG